MCSKVDSFRLKNALCTIIDLQCVILQLSFMLLIQLLLWNCWLYLEKIKNLNIP